MGMKRQLCVGLSLLLAINVVHGVFAQTQFEVGDEAGWTLPSLANVNYTSWTSGHKYHVGDTLLFTYVVAIHNVVQVSSQEDYDTCNSNNPIAVHGSGKTAITLTEAGPYYFICGTPGHCSLGQKLSLVAGPASLTTPSTTDPSADHKSLDSFVPYRGPLAQPPGNSGVTYLVSWVILLVAVVLSSAFFA